MKRISRLFISLVVVSFALAILVFAQKQTQKPPGGKLDPHSGDSGNQEIAKKKGKNLVKKLPDGVEGVTLEDGYIKLKPGYKFVKGKNDKVSVNLMKGSGPSLDGMLGCGCYFPDGGSCKVNIYDDILICSSQSACTYCRLQLMVGSSKTSIIAYSSHPENTSR